LVAAAAPPSTSLLLSPPQAYGSSMTPTLAFKGDVVLLDMSAPYRWRAATRAGDGTSDALAVGDVVTLSKPTDRRVSIIKRIGGLVRIRSSCLVTRDLCTVLLMAERACGSLPVCL